MLTTNISKLKENLLWRPVATLCMYVQARNHHWYKANVSLQCRQSNWSNALSNCLEMIVGSVELNASKLWELFSENLLGRVKHDVSNVSLQ
jgi:hypothetical protein